MFHFLSQMSKRPNDYEEEPEPNRLKKSLRSSHSAPQLHMQLSYSRTPVSRPKVSRLKRPSQQQQKQQMQTSAVVLMDAITEIAMEVEHEVNEENFDNHSNNSSILSQFPNQENSFVLSHIPSPPIPGPSRHQNVSISNDRIALLPHIFWKKPKVNQAIVEGLVQYELFEAAEKGCQQNQTKYDDSVKKCEELKEQLLEQEKVAKQAAEKFNTFATRAKEIKDDMFQGFPPAEISTNEGNEWDIRMDLIETMSNHVNETN
jgi:hypothetical protein